MVSRCHGRGPKTQNRAPCGAKAPSCAMSDMTMSCAVEPKRGPYRGKEAI